MKFFFSKKEVQKIRSISILLLVKISQFKTMTENIDPNVGSINLLVQAAFDDDDDFYFIASPKKLRKIEGDIYYYLLNY